MISLCTDRDRLDTIPMAQKIRDSIWCLDQRLDTKTPVQLLSILHAVELFQRDIYLRPPDLFNFFYSDTKRGSFKNFNETERDNTATPSTCQQQLLPWKDSDSACTAD